MDYKYNKIVLGSVASDYQSEADWFSDLSFSGLPVQMKIGACPDDDREINFKL